MYANVKSCSCASSRLTWYLFFLGFISSHLCPPEKLSSIVYMETEGSNDLPPAFDSVRERENDDLHNSNCETNGAGSQPSNSEIIEDELNGEVSGALEVDVGDGGGQPVVADDLGGDLIGSSSVMEVSVELNETVVVADDVKCFRTEIRTENDLVTVHDGSPISNRKRGGSPISNHEIDDSRILLFYFLEYLENGIFPLSLSCLSTF